MSSFPKVWIGSNVWFGEQARIPILILNTVWCTIVVNWQISCGRLLQPDIAGARWTSPWTVGFDETIITKVLKPCPCERLTVVYETLRYIPNVWIGSNVVGKHGDVQYLQVGECLDMESEQPQCMTKLYCMILRLHVADCNLPLVVQDEETLGL